MQLNDWIRHPWYYRHGWFQIILTKVKFVKSNLLNFLDSKSQKWDTIEHSTKKPNLQTCLGYRFCGPLIKKLLLFCTCQSYKIPPRWDLLGKIRDEDPNFRLEISKNKLWNFQNGKTWKTMNNILRTQQLEMVYI